MLQGGSAERTDKVDREGAIKSMDACALAGVKRYIIVSATDVRDRNKTAPSWYNDGDRSISDRTWGAIGAYMAAKLAADKDLVENNGRRKLDYTIVRPGALGEGEGTSQVSAGKIHFGQKIPRNDVARVVAEVLKNDGTIGLVFDVVGGETPIPEAIQKVAEDKTNTFEGRF
jgi:nucleoside-diphosphate-sugar epimerase